MRKLKSFEIPLVEICFEQVGISFTNTIEAESMDDSNMGSLLFNKNLQINNFAATECYFYDKDNVLVSVTLNTTANNEPVELDIWKVNNSPLIQWPSKSEIKLGTPNKSFNRDAPNRRAR